MRDALPPPRIFMAGRLLTCVGLREMAAITGLSQRAVQLAESEPTTLLVADKLVGALNRKGVGIRPPEGALGFGIYYLHPSDEIPEVLLATGRRLAHLTQQQLAILARLNRRTIIRAEAGKSTRPIVSTLVSTLTTSGVRVLPPSGAHGYGLCLTVDWERLSAAAQLVAGGKARG